MTVTAATAAVILIGALAMLPVVPASGRYGYAALILPAGFAIYIVSGTTLVAAGVYSSRSALAVGAAAGMAITIVWWARSSEARTIRWREVLIGVATVVAAAALVSLVTSAANLTRLSSDSLRYLALAGAMERVGSLDPVSPHDLVVRLVGTPLLHSPAFAGAGYMETWTPLVGVSGVTLTAWLGQRALRTVGTPPSWIPWILGSALALVVTTNRVLFNLFYINGHAAFATFLVLGVGCAWYACVARRRVMLLPAATGFAVLPMLRPEAVIVVILFLVTLIVSGHLSNTAKWALVLPVAATTVLWNGLALPPHLEPDQLAITSPVLSNLFGGAGLVALTAAASISRLRPVVRWAPLAIALLMGAYVAARTARAPTLLSTAASAMGANLASDGAWSLFWYVTPVLFVTAVVVVRFRLQEGFVYPLATWPLALLFFTFLRDSGYRVGAGDSGNRMMMHVVFVLILYLVTATGVGVGLLEPETASSHTVDEPGAGYPPAPDPGAGTASGMPRVADSASDEIS